MDNSAIKFSKKYTLERNIIFEKFGYTKSNEEMSTKTLEH